jgi:hypothetical protein
MFFGITIRMFVNEHGPPHFHAEHQSQRAIFDFAGELIAGEMKSARARRLIAEWAVEHGDELRSNWERGRAGRPLEDIPPLT